MPTRAAILSAALASALAALPAGPAAAQTFIEREVVTSAPALTLDEAAIAAADPAFAGRRPVRIVTERRVETSEPVFAPAGRAVTRTGRVTERRALRDLDVEATGSVQPVRVLRREGDGVVLPRRAIGAEGAPLPTRRIVERRPPAMMAVGERRQVVTTRRTVILEDEAPAEPTVTTQEFLRY